MAYSVSEKTIKNWTVYGQEHYLHCLINADFDVNENCENYVEQQIIASIPILFAIFPNQKKIYLYSHHLNYERFLIRNDLANKSLESHISKILSIDLKKMPTEIQKCKKYDFPNFFDDIYWIHASADTYILVDKFIKKLNQYFHSPFEILTNWQLSLVAKHDSLRVHLLKFLSLLPSLDFDKTGEIVIKNLNESINLCISDNSLPKWLHKILNFAKFTVNLPPSKISANIIRWSVRKLATRFVVDEKNSQKTLGKIFKSGRSVTLDRLGELVLSEQEADKYCEEVIEVIRNLSSKIKKGQKNDSNILDSHVSIKVSALCSQFKPEAYQHTFNRVAPRLKKIFDTAIKYETFVNIDAEHYEYRDCVFQIFKDVLKSYETWQDVGMVVQCYLRDSYKHLEQIKDFAQSRNILMPVRLVKGAYWDAETIEAEVNGHTAYQFLNKEETDICFRQCIGYCFEYFKSLQICVGSHNFIDHLFVEKMWSVARPYAPRPEHQCLHKTHEALSITMKKNGWVVREYLPIGDLLDGMAYLVRRIMENSSQKGVLNMMRVHNTSSIKIPPVHLHLNKINDGKIIRDTTLNFSQDFVNTPSVRLYNKNEKNALDKAIEIYSIDHIQNMSNEELNTSLIDLEVTQSKWESTTKQFRAGILVEAADKLLIRRNEFAVYIAKETHKCLSESLADVDEAIDFLNYYANCEVKLKNEKARGPLAIIAPWNFPLAIPCGMSVASLVAGNITFLKSSNKSHFVAKKFVELMHECGVPTNVLIHVNGDRHIGESLLQNENIAGCIFTGSKKVGGELIKKLSTRIIRRNGIEYQTKIIAETGGKNTIVVTQTADMDEAISGVLYSSFAHAGQKCSACSRVLVHKNIKKKFVERIKQAINSLVVDSELNYASFVNPVIDQTEMQRLLKIQQDIYDQITKRRIGKVHVYNQEQNKVNPMLVELDMQNALMNDVHFNDELFGPILHLVEFENDDEVKEIFKNTTYALTGGIFSQSANEINLLDWDLNCGNVYINRNITGARVGVEPFGGYKASGTGPKAGGETYLDSFHVSDEPSQVWYRGYDKVIQKPGQTGYIKRLYAKDICFVLNKKMSEFVKSCIQEQIYRRQHFDVLCCDAESNDDIIATIDAMDTVGGHEIVTKLDKSKNYEIFVIGNDVHDYMLEKIKEGISTEKVLPIIISKYDHITSKSFSDLFYYTRTYAINTMKHGAELS